MASKAIKVVETIKEGKANLHATLTAPRRKRPIRKRLIRTFPRARVCLSRLGKGTGSTARNHRVPVLLRRETT